MHVDVHGPETATEVLLLHGGTGAGDYHWRKTARSLGQDWRLCVPDLPGHGRSPLATSRYDRDVLVEAVDELISQRGAPAHVTGFSMGGNAALQLAAQRPERFASLALIGVSVRDHRGLEGWRANFDADRLEAEHPLWAKTLQRIHTPLGGPDSWREVLARDAGGVGVDVDVEALGGLECPVLVMRGDRDPAVDVDQQAEIRAAVGEQAEECVVPAGGHEVQMTRAGVVSVVLDDFWSRALR